MLDFHISFICNWSIFNFPALTLHCMHALSVNILRTNSCLFIYSVITFEALRFMHGPDRSEERRLEVLYSSFNVNSSSAQRCKFANIVKFNRNIILFRWKSIVQCLFRLKNGMADVTLQVRSKSTTYPTIYSTQDQIKTKPHVRLGSKLNKLSENWSEHAYTPIWWCLLIELKNSKLN